MSDTRWLPFGNHILLPPDMTSSPHVADLKGYTFKRHIYPQSPLVTILAFIFVKLYGVGGGGGGKGAQSAFLGPRRHNKPDLDRVDVKY